MWGNSITNQVILQQRLATSIDIDDITVMSGDITVMSGDITVMSDDITVMCGDITVMSDDITTMSDDITVIVTTSWSLTVHGCCD